MSPFFNSILFHNILVIVSEVQYSQQHNNFFNFLPSPSSIIIFLCRPFFTVFWFSSIFSFNWFGTCRHFSSWLAAHEFILTRVFPHYFLGGVNFPYFLTPPLATLLLDALPIHRFFLNLHYFVVSYPYCAYFLLQLEFECLLHQASKFNPYPVQSLFIHWLHIVNPILLPMHDRTRNLGFCIFPKCDTSTCPYCHVRLPHILENILLFCFLRPVLLRNKVLNIFAGTLP